MSTNLENFWPVTTSISFAGTLYRGVQRRKLETEEYLLRYHYGLALQTKIWEVPWHIYVLYIYLYAAGKAPIKCP